MKLSGLHLLLTYQCNFECDHCFVWGSPRQSGTMTLENVREILGQAKALETVEWIYFEGGEPFLYYPILLQGAMMAAHMDFKVGIVSNAYWATDVQDAIEWLRPFSGLIQGLSVSSDLFHYNQKLSQQAKNASAAAGQLGIPVGVITISHPNEPNARLVVGQLPPDESAVMYRGRAAEKLTSGVQLQPWDRFTACTRENLREPGRVHIDASGNPHICQGITLGNIFDSSLREICKAYDPDRHPIIGPLVAAGPAELVKRYELPHEQGYVDACHLCYAARRALRNRFPEILGPDQMYGVPQDAS